MTTEGQNEAELALGARVRRVTWIGLLANVVLAVLKAAAGYWGGSRALVADAVHSLSDVSTDVAVIVGVSYWSRPPDAEHPHGHHRIEPLVAIGIGVLLAFTGVALGYEALVTLQGMEHDAPGVPALYGALISIVTKEGLYWWTRKVNKEVRSSALRANAWHHRSDALSSIPVAAAVGLSWLYPSLAFLDSVGAIIVSVFILVAAYSIIRPEVNKLIDAGAPGEDVKRIKELASGRDGVCGVHAVRTRYKGAGLAVDLHLTVSPEWTVRRGHRVSEEVRLLLLEQGPDVVEVVVHLEPCKEDHPHDD